MAEISSYRDLHVWQNAVELVTDCYRLSSKFMVAGRQSHSFIFCGSQTDHWPNWRRIF
jgi:hypothetical protein